MKEKLMKRMKAVYEGLNILLPNTDIVFTGSWVLKVNDLLDREVSDEIDIILMPKNYVDYTEIWREQVIKTLKALQSLFPNRNGESGSHCHDVVDSVYGLLDIYFTEERIKTVEVKGERFLFTTTSQILKKKKEFDRPKDKEDIINVIMNLSDRITEKYG